jgi:ribosomal protein S18 acetylase RimI-like enzyme
MCHIERILMNAPGTEYIHVGEWTGEFQPPHPHEIDALRIAIGWGETEHAVLARALHESRYVAYTRDKHGTLVGFGRVHEDGMYCMFYDIGVHPDCQRQGIGRHIMTELVTKVRKVEYIGISLFIWEENEGVDEFYGIFGFDSVGSGMKLLRRSVPLD